MGGELDFLPADKHKSFLRADRIFLESFFVTSQENMKDEVDFLPTDERQRSFYIDTIILGGYGQACPNYPEWQVYYLFAISSERTEWWSCFLHADKHERLIQIDSILLMGIFKHSQSSQNSNFAMSLQYLKNEIRWNRFFACR